MSLDVPMVGILALTRASCDATSMTLSIRRLCVHGLEYAYIHPKIEDGRAFSVYSRP